MVGIPNGWKEKQQRVRLRSVGSPFKTKRVHGEVLVVRAEGVWMDGAMLLPACLLVCLFVVLRDHGSCCCRQICSWVEEVAVCLLPCLQHTERAPCFGASLDELRVMRMDKRGGLAFFCFLQAGGRGQVGDYCCSLSLLSVVFRLQQLHTDRARCSCGEGSCCVGTRIIDETLIFIFCTLRSGALRVLLRLFTSSQLLASLLSFHRPRKTTGICFRLQLFWACFFVR